MPPMPPTPETAELDTATAAPRTALARRMAERLPEILIEALFTLIAVVLAFAVEEWREERELDGLAAEARSAMLQEVSRNRDELIESKQETTDSIAALERWLEQAGQREPAARPSPALPDPAVKLELALLSSAAWRAAQSTEASRRMDYTWLLQISQTYELQAVFQEAQAAAIEALVTHRTSVDEASRQATARALLGRIRVLKSFGQSLEEDYADIL